MKPFYTNKGKYADGRKKVVIMYENGKKSFALPKPEELLDRLKVSTKTIKSQRSEVDR